MAGSPRNRARRMAEEERRLEATGDWMIQPVKFLTDPPEVAEKKQAASMTAKWWRTQVGELERAAREREGALAKGADAVHASQARVFGALGVPTDVAAALMGMSEGEFQGKYAESYGVGSATMIGQVSANLLRIATEGDDRYAVKAAVEIMNRRGGEPWRPPAQKIEVNRTETKARLIDSSKLTQEEREQLRQILLAAAAREGTPALESDGD
jgi:hypothetical protein